eukprot:161641-Chlamydomonas_euryale.AAC.1
MGGPGVSLHPAGNTGGWLLRHAWDIVHDATAAAAAADAGAAGTGVAAAGAAPPRTPSAMLVAPPSPPLARRVSAAAPVSPPHSPLARPASAMPQHLHPTPQAPPQRTASALLTASARAPHPAGTAELGLQRARAGSASPQLLAGGLSELHSR